MKRVFISSAFSGDIEKNTRLAVQYGKHAMSLGVAPYVPHLLYPNWTDESDPKQRQAGIEAGLEFLRVCDELWAYFPNEKQVWTEGMVMEREEAFNLKKPVLVFLRDHSGTIMFGTRYRNERDFRGHE